MLSSTRPDSAKTQSQYAISTIRGMGRPLLTLLLLLALLLPIVSCSRNRAVDLKPARYGPGGRQLALEIVSKFPERKAGSTQEAATADYLAQKLRDLGLEVQIQNFNFSVNGISGSSRNVIALLKGTGFQEDKAQTEASLKNGQPKLQVFPDSPRRLLIGAHYDSERTGQSNADFSRHNGLHDNAAGVAAVLTAATEMKKQIPGYDVYFVFFGAGSANFAGARAYLDSLGASERTQMDAMYNISRIYAGDKVYAHAGQNSLAPGDAKSYLLRRKLYECTDVYYDNLLNTHNGFSIFTNQSIFSVPLNGQNHIYREWTLHQSDHSPFDQAGIPVVFFESYEYDLVNLESQVRESTDPFFSSVNGVISGSPLDASEVLLAHFSARMSTAIGGEVVALKAGNKTEATSPETDNYLTTVDRLENRINNLAFILVEAAQKNPQGLKKAD